MRIPDQDQQIIQTHAAFICQVVEFSQNPDRTKELEAILKSAADNGWENLVGAVRQVLGGRREISTIKGLDQEDRVIAEAIMRGLQDPATLPDPNRKPDPTMAAPGLANMIHAAATGNAQALILIGNMAEQMSKAGGDMARVAAIIRPMINGERDPNRLCRNMNAQTEQLVIGILQELGKLEIH